MKLTAIGAGATLVVAGAGVVMATGANAAVPAAAFAETATWDGGYTGQYTITNTTSSAISSWTVVFSLPGGSIVDSLWNGTESVSGQTYTVANASWNGTLAAGASTTFGFTVNGTGEPNSCTINGNACAGTTTSSASASPSAAPTTASPSASASATKSATKSASPSASASSTSASPSASATTSAPSSGGYGKFSPYADLSLYPLYDLSGSAATEGTKYFNLAFITTGSTACTPEWGGVTAITDSSIGTDIADLRAAGGDVRVSFGGEAGTELAQSCTSASSLAAAYQSVIKQYSLTEIDFDVEGAAIADTTSINLRNQAIAILESEDSGLQVSYTLPVLPTGLTGEGVAVLSNAKADGASIAAVNVMAMDYGSSFPGDMATLAEEAATATMQQVQSVWTSLTTAQAYAKIAVTPMIGVNDVNTETFTVADASALASWAKTNGLAWLAMWSATRDSECSGGAQTYADATCSSVVQSAGAFGKALSAY
ncbi:cellulose binding domain-containing protein [Actinospica durhamensis]|uniref:Cellulose binding domain-containing protein n=1 Tax=Actinospica durhamensis TaxID=1508375 RepID=A0A941IKZ5_9ACTN|nr:cellulose binding domain-containing protein [Actinospica durhamensis]MBR7832410.1 cellulose binding domain-containing protein [Actinospica durhamensis]